MSDTENNKREKVNTSQQENPTDEQLKALNFDIKEVSREELEKTIRNTEPALEGCGLCKIVIGSG